MSFIDNKGIVCPEITIALSLGQQNAICHYLQVSFFGGAIFKPNFIADGPAEFLTEFLGNSTRHCHGRNSSGLSMTDDAVDASSRGQAKFW